MEPRIYRPSLSSVLTLARYLVHLTRDTAEINMAAASISSKRGNFAFFLVYLVRTPRCALSIVMLASARDLNYVAPHTRLGASYIDARYSG